MASLLTEEDLLAIEARWRASSASSRSYDQNPWRVQSGSYTGEDWLVASCGCNSEDGMDYYVTTQGVHASELRGDACGDATFIANCGLDVKRLALAYRELQQQNELLKQENLAHIERYRATFSSMFK